MARIKIKESDGEISKRMKAILTNEAKARSRRNQPRVRALIKYELFNAIYECMEMESLRSGKLKFDFGLDSDPTVAIAEAVSDAFRTKYTIDISTMFGFEIYIQPFSYLNLLSLPEGVQITEKGEDLPWLEWLLTYGSTMICISNYGVKYMEGGRSGGATMVKGYNFGRPFMVDPAYAGTPYDNFITRAISEHKDRIVKAAWQIIQI